MTRPATPGLLSENKKKLLDLYRRGSQPVRPAAPSRQSGEAAPLSSEQRLIWLHCQLAPSLPLYNEMVTIRRTGALDTAALQQTLNEIVRRHEAWRTRFRTVDDAPVQIVDPPFAVSLPVTDLSHLPESEREAEALRLASNDVREPMDLATGPLLRARLVRLSEAEHHLFLTLHQIIQDGTSVYSVLLPELAALYERFARQEPSSLAELPLQYPDYALRQAQEGHDRDARSSAESLAYWRDQLSGWTPLDLPTDEARPHFQSFRGRQETFRLSPRLTEALKRLAQRENVTLFVVLLAAYKVLLHRYSGQDDVLVGTVLSTRKGPEVEKLLGVFLNTLVLRTTVSDDLTFARLLATLKEVTVQALSHGQLPYPDLLRELQPKRDPARSPFFQAMFVFEPPRPEPPPGWDLTPMDVDAGTVRVDLHLQMDDRPEGVCAHLRYNADLWDAPTIRRLIDHYQVLLESVVLDPHSTISAIPLLTPSEREGARLAARVTEPRPANEFARFESGDIEQSIAQRFAQQVAAHGDRIAVDEKLKWTYRDLDQAADRVACAVTASMTSGPIPVALLLEQDAAMVAAVLGVLKTPSPYVPLDPTHPPERLAKIAADAGATTLLVSRAHHPLLPELIRSGLVPLFLDEVLQTPHARYTGPAAAPEDVAYILYTSGSTGTPKGVKQNHRNVLHFIGAYTNNLHICPDDRLTLLAPYGVDAAVMDIFGAVLNGAALHPVDVKSAGLPGVRERLVRDGITIFHSTPTLYRHLVRELAGSEKPETVRLVVLGGEEVRREDVDTFREHFASHCLMVNGFGPTESTVTLQHFVDMGSPEERRSVPIGYPVERTSVSLLSRDGRPGQVYGEIAIRSAHVALGYWRNDELTQRAFIAAPPGSEERVYKTGDMGRLLPDGRVEFRGRRDLQTKIQGFRVELGEVEAALVRHRGIKEAVVTVWQPSGEDNKRLAAYFVAGGAASPTDDELRRFLRSKLPGPMIPSAFVRLDALPMTASGKLDRRALPEPPVIGVPSALDGPRDGVEEELVAIWARALRIDAVGIRDDFFALGGHSVIALKLMSDVYARFGVNLPLATLFESPTIERFADILRSAAPDRERGEVLAVQPAGNRTPLFCVQSHLEEAGLYGDLARHLGSDQPVFALPVSDVAGSVRRDIPALATESLKKIRSVQAEGPYRLAGSGSGALVAFEMAQQLVARGERMASLAVFWWAPHKTPLAKRVQDHLQRLRGLSVEQKLGYVVHEARAARDAASKTDYVPRPYSGKMTLFRGNGAPRAVDARHLDGMSAREMEVIEVPGDHETMFREPFVSVLAERLEEVLSRDGAQDGAICR